MAGGVDMIFQKEFEDLGVNIGFMAIRNTPASRGRRTRASVSISDKDMGDTGGCMRRAEWGGS